MGITPEELYEMYKEEKNTADERDRGQTADQVIYFMTQQEKQGYSKSKSRQTAKAVSSFFRANKAHDFKLPRMERVYSKQGKTAQPEEVRTYIHNANVRTAAIIALLKDSGLRSGDLCNVRLNQVQKCLDEKAEWCFITLSTEKEGLWAYTMIGPEAMHYLRLYLKDRARRKIESEWLICGHLKRRGANKLTSNDITAIFDVLQKKTGIKGFSAHSLRRFHTSQLTADGLDSNWVKLAQGKSLDPAMAPYFDPSKLPELYKKHYNALTVLEVRASYVENIERQLADFRELLGFNSAKELKEALQNAKEEKRKQKIEDEKRFNEMLKPLESPFKGQTITIPPFHNDEGFKDDPHYRDDPEGAKREYYENAVAESMARKGKSKDELEIEELEKKIAEVKARKNKT